MIKETEKIRIKLTEWQEVNPETEELLVNRFLDPKIRLLAEKLTHQGILDIAELRNGIRIKSTSYIGFIRLGNIEIYLSPKISGMPLLTLFRYAYQLKNLFINKKMSLDVKSMGIQDLLIIQLINEVNNLIKMGMARKYLRQQRSLDFLRGKIDFQTIVKSDFTVRSQLPCVIHPRTHDCLLNQVIKAGLHLASNLTEDRRLRYECLQLAKYMDKSVSEIKLERYCLQKVKIKQNRLTASYEPSLVLIEMLLDSKGVIFRDENKKVHIPGFLFDMNRLFQAVLSRFLKSNLSEYQVFEECSIKSMMRYLPDYNPLNRRSPIPRPDFIIQLDGKTKSILDAKYRDLWDKSLPREMLYQIGMYALSQRDTRKAAILYPTMYESAREARIQISDPTYANKLGTVILRPVNLNDLCRMIELPYSSMAARERNKYAKHLAFGDE